MKHSIHANNSSSSGSESQFWDPYLRPYIEYVIPIDIIDFFEIRKKKQKKRKQELKKEKELKKELTQKEQKKQIDLRKLIEFYNIMINNMITLVQTVAKIINENKDKDTIPINTDWLSEVNEIHLDNYIYPNAKEVVDVIQLLLDKIIEIDNGMQIIIDVVAELEKIDEPYEVFFKRVDKLFEELSNV
jgi:hypothetical protein